LKISNPPVSRQPELDGLRGLATILVVAFHCWFFLQFVFVSQQRFLDWAEGLPGIFSFIHRGDIAVDTFFVSSGFLLSWQLFRERIVLGKFSAGRFYLHRIMRVYPLYLVALAIGSINDGPTVRWLGNIFAYNIWYDPTEILVPWTWSLSVEIQFYAIVPLLLLFATTGRRVALLVAFFCAVSLAWTGYHVLSYPELTARTMFEIDIARDRELLSYYFKTMYVAFPMRMGQFAIGIGLAWLIAYRADELRKLPKHIVVLMAVGVVLLGLVPYFYNPVGASASQNLTLAKFDQIFGRISFGLSSAMLIMLAHLNLVPAVKRFLSMRFLEVIARLSFSIYFFHPPFVALGIMLFVGTEGITSVSLLQYLAVFGLTMAASVMLGFVTWYGLEKPAIQWGRRLATRLFPK